MIPLKDNIPTSRFPIITFSLIAVNVVVFLADQHTGHYEILRAVTRTGIPVQIKHFEGGLSAQYAMIPAEVTSNLAAVWPTVFASMFLHANWLHVGSNMLMLWVFGNNVEDTIGRARYLIFYFACGVAAAAAHIYSSPNSQLPTVGASGAVAGMMGAYMVLFPHAEILTFVPIFFFGAFVDVPAILVIGFWAAMQFLNASWLGGGEMLRGGGIAYFAHLGGLAAGIVGILLLGGRRLTYRRGDWREDEYYR
jgi:membrane associated rhomboid family serine protease